MLQKNTPSPRVAVVGPENTANIRLVETLHSFVPQDQVYAFLRTAELLQLTRQDGVDVILVDLFAFDLGRITDVIGTVREENRIPSFVLYVDKEDVQQRWDKLPRAWRTRLTHYYRLYKEPPDVPIDPLVRSIVREGMSYAQQFDSFRKQRPPTVLPKHRPTLDDLRQTAAETSDPVVFISYSRQDWDGFVSRLVQRLNQRAVKTWIDQDMLIGGEDWMNAIGAALEECAALTLIVSPEAVASRYVRMEYRYFFNKEKPILPLLLRPADVPPELSLYQHVDFVQNTFDAAFDQYVRALDRALNASR